MRCWCGGNCGAAGFAEKTAQDSEKSEFAAIKDCLDFESRSLFKADTIDSHLLRCGRERSMSDKSSCLER